MRNTSKVIAMSVSMFTLMAFATITKSYAPSMYSMKPLVLETYPIVPIEVEIEDKPIAIIAKGHDDFLDAIGQKESNNNYLIVNTYGYMGKYQFGKSTLKGLGYKLTREQFLNSPYIQEEAMQKLLAHNKKKLQKYIDKYDNKTIHGVYITESGILAAAHLAGQGNVKKFFRKGYEFKDGFGTKMTTYMELFSGYSLNFN
tara:strand:+ start:182 stop:781 length:600 start_codon:yes stop_codon:yes gene_type:complete